MRIPEWYERLDRLFIRGLRLWSIPALRVALGIVFLWFGLLKIFGVSPVAGLVTATYSFLPEPAFVTVLGIWEALIGVGLLFQISLRLTLFFLWLQMAGTLVAPLLSPQTFFESGNVFRLTLEGEFIVKNLVLIAAGLVIGGYGVKPKS
jgi:uncharacterized membrane protein YkgB